MKKEHFMHIVAAGVLIIACICALRCYQDWQERAKGQEILDNLHKKTYEYYTTSPDSSAWKKPLICPIEPTP